MTKIGFLGLGNMGGPMAARLAAAGHRVLGYDPAAQPPAGVAAAADARSAAREAEIVITMLPDGAIVRAAIAEIAAALPAGACVVDCSTIDVASSERIARELAERGVSCLDAPVSGGIKGASEGTLTFMVGGPEDAFERARPLFEIMGARAIHCGAAGAGQAAKLCNNMILGATMAVTCESFALADRLGLARDKLYEVVSTSSGQSWSTTSYCPAPGVGPRSPADDDYAPGFAAELMLKDLRLAIEAAERTGARTPVGARALAEYQRFVEKGGRGRDFSALLTALANDV